MPKNRAVSKKKRPCDISQKRFTQLLRLLGIDPAKLLGLIANGSLARALLPLVSDKGKVSSHHIDSFEREVRNELFQILNDQPALKRYAPEYASPDGIWSNPLFPQGRTPPKQESDDLDAGDWDDD